MIRFSVIRRLRRRLHVKCTGWLFTDAQAAYIEEMLERTDAIEKAQFFTRSGEVVVIHNGDEAAVYVIWI
nr:hypothetical protein [uncultured Veillonella sp.]